MNKLDNTFKIELLIFIIKTIAVIILNIILFSLLVNKDTEIDKTNDIEKVQITNSKDININNTEISQFKIDWIQENIDKEILRIEEQQLSVNNVVIIYEDTEFVFPISGDELQDKNIELINNYNIISNSVSYGNKIQTENGSILDCGFINDSNRSLTQQQCIISYIVFDKNNDLVISLSSKTNEKSFDITIGESLNNINKQLYNNGYIINMELTSETSNIKDMQYINTKEELKKCNDNLLKIYNNGDNWILTLNRYEVNKMQSKDKAFKSGINDDVKALIDKIPTKIGYITYTLYGTYSNGLESVRVDYNYIDAKSNLQRYNILKSN